MNTATTSAAIGSFDDADFHDFCQACHGGENSGHKYCAECDWLL